MAFSIRFNEEKNEILKATRGIGFEEIIKHIANGSLLDDRVHTGKDRAHQRLYIVKVDQYVYAVPYVINRQKQEIYLKTIYPSRQLTKQYLSKGEQNV